MVCYLAGHFAPVKMGRVVSLNQHCHRKFLRPLQPLPGVWSDSDLRGAELVFGRVWGKNGPSFRFPTLEQTEGNKQGWIIRGRYQGNFDKLSGICRLWKGRRLEKTSCLTFKAWHTHCIRLTQWSWVDTGLEILFGRLTLRPNIYQGLVVASCVFLVFNVNVLNVKSL